MTTLGPAAQLLHELAALESAEPSFPAVITIADCELNPWNWLNGNEGQSRFVWSDRNAPDVWAGLGEACRVEVGLGGSDSDYVARCREHLNGNRELKFFGGLSFDGQDQWEGFGPGNFVIPRFQLANGELKLAVMNADDIQQARVDVQRTCFDVRPAEHSLPAPASVNHVPDVEGWHARVDEALTLIRGEAVEKIVLSRKTVLQFEQDLNPIALTERLHATTHDCFVFCLDFGQGRAFTGATPEQLFQRQQDRLQSEVIAGTRMRGATPEDDQRLATELLNSDKDQREHDIVRKSIRQKLHKYVDHLTVDTQASLLRLARKQHLRSNVEGQLKPGVDDGTLLRRLHPTPAVGGYPTDNALPEIARIEPFNRGWYAAPVGWIGADNAQFAVAIRSGLIDTSTLSLYSGAGIVRGSKAAEEWQEVENKIQDFVNVLGDRDRE